MKHGMDILSKFRAEERKIKGEDVFKQVLAKCQEFQEPWYGLEVCRDVICMQGKLMLDKMLEEHMILWKHEAKKQKEAEA